MTGKSREKWTSVVVPTEVEGPTVLNYKFNCGFLGYARNDNLC